MVARGATAVALWRCLRACAALAVAATAAGCASLPPPPDRPPSVALPAALESPLGRLAQLETAPSAAHHSGFVLMPTGPFALKTRLDILRMAQRALDVQAFHIHDDETGRLFLRALRDGADRGVRIRLLLDDLHTAGQDELLLGLAAHRNVELRLFNPFAAARGSLPGRFIVALADFWRLHRRMHNKLLIADGVMAIVGGRNIGSDYFTRLPDGNFLDLDTLVAGPTVAALSRQFDDYWNSASAWPVADVARSPKSPSELRALFDTATGSARAPEPDFPTEPDLFDLEPALQGLSSGRTRWVLAAAETIADAPDKVTDTPDLDDDLPPPAVHSIRSVLVEHLRQARKEILVASPYVVPTRRSRATVALLRERGVSITVVTNSLAATDEPIAWFAYRRHRDTLLAQGVELFELAPMRVPTSRRFNNSANATARLHAKVAVIDRQRVFIGSFNFDHRSARYNTETGLIIHSPELAAQAHALLSYVQETGTARARLQADGSVALWERGPDGNERVREEPAAGLWRRLAVRLFALLIPDDLL